MCSLGGYRTKVWPDDLHQQSEGQEQWRSSHLTARHLLMISFPLNRYLRVSACSSSISISLHSEHTISMQIDSVTPKLDRLSLGLTTTATGALTLQGTVEIVLPWIEGRKGWRVCRQRRRRKAKILDSQRVRQGDEVEARNWICDCGCQGWCPGARAWIRREGEILQKWFVQVSTSMTTEGIRKGWTGFVSGQELRRSDDIDFSKGIYREPLLPEESGTEVNLWETTAHRGTTSSKAGQHRTLMCGMGLVVRTVKMKKTEERTKCVLKKESCVFQGRAQTGCWSGASGDWTATANVNLKQYVTRIYLWTHTFMDKKEGLIAESLGSGYGIL